MTDPRERAQYHRDRAEQFRRQACSSSVRTIRETYVGLANIEEALAAQAERLSMEQKLRSQRRKPVRWLRRKEATDRLQSSKAK